MAARIQTQEWQNGLCSCSPCDSCLFGTFLPGILFGRSSQRLRNPSEKHVDNFNGDCALFCGLQVFLGCGWILNMTKRKEIRERFGIEGSGCSDCCVSYWCPCCALIQQDNEVKGRLLQEAVTHGYEAQENMQLNQQQNTKY